LSIDGVDEDLAIFETDGSNTIVNFLLTKRRFAILTLGAVDEGGRFGVKTVQALRLLVHKCVVLRHELPPNFRGNNVVVDLRRSHDEERR
jgi:hypothetical protein